MERYAVEADVNVVSVAYRLCPETKFPGGAADAYAAFMYVAKNPTKFGCDPTKLGFFGEESGG